MSTGKIGRGAVTGEPMALAAAGWRVEGSPDRAALRAAVERVHARHQATRPAAPRVGRPVMRSFLIDTEPQARAVLRRELGAGDGWHPVFVAVRSTEVAFFGFVACQGDADALAGELSAAYNALAAGRTPRSAAGRGLALDGTRSRRLVADRV